MSPLVRCRVVPTPKLCEPCSCSVCGDPTRRRFPPTVCAACGAHHWSELEAGLRSALITAGDSLLLVRRANEPWRDHWDVPGGFCDARRASRWTRRCGRSLEEGRASSSVRSLKCGWIATSSSDDRSDPTEDVLVDLLLPGAPVKDDALAPRRSGQRSPRSAGSSPIRSHGRSPLPAASTKPGVGRLARSDRHRTRSLKSDCGDGAFERLHRSVAWRNVQGLRLRGASRARWRESALGELGHVSDRER